MTVRSINLRRTDVTLFTLFLTQKFGVQNWNLFPTCVGGHPGKKQLCDHLRRPGGPYKAAGLHKYTVQDKLVKYRLEILKCCKMRDLFQVIFVSYLTEMSTPLSHMKKNFKQQYMAMNQCEFQPQCLCFKRDCSECTGGKLHYKGQTGKMLLACKEKHRQRSFTLSLFRVGKVRQTTLS